MAYVSAEVVKVSAFVGKRQVQSADGGLVKVAVEDEKVEVRTRSRMA